MRKLYSLKNIFAYCGYSSTYPFFLLLSEHKHCNNAATNSNSENARSRMVASLPRNVGTGTKEDELSTGRVWAAEFHRVTARSGLARVLKIMNHFFNFPYLFFSDRGKTRILNPRIGGPPAHDYNFACCFVWP